MDINISTGSTHNINHLKFQKMLLVFNAVNDGWSVKKKWRQLYFFERSRRQVGNLFGFLFANFYYFQFGYG